MRNSLQSLTFATSVESVKQIQSLNVPSHLKQPHDHPDCFKNLSLARLHSIMGGIAQLGERLHGMQEVSGSIPLTSTKFKFLE